MEIVDTPVCDDCIEVGRLLLGCYHGKWEGRGKNQKEEINPSLVTALVADVVAAFPDCKCLAVAEVDADASVMKMLSHKANEV